MHRWKPMVWIVGLTAFAVAGGPALAVTPQPVAPRASLIQPVVDQEDLAVEEDLRPDEVPASESGEEMMPAPDRAEAESGGGNVEDEELQRDLDTAE